MVDDRRKRTKRGPINEEALLRIGTYYIAIEQLKNWVVHTAYATLKSGKYK